MNKEQENFYKQDIVDHAKNPRNYGVLEGANLVSGEYNPSCGDAVSITALVQNNRIIDITFQGTGCVLSLAMASKLTEKVRGMEVLGILNLDDESLVHELLSIPIGPNRIKCGLLSIFALKKGLKSMKS